MSLIYYMSEIKPWKKLSTEIVINNDRLKIRKDVCLLPDGTILPDFYVREDKDVAIVFCLTKNKEVILVRQYRHGAGGEGEITLELPAGLKDSHDHSIEDTARRELLEETGYACDIMQKKAEWLLTATSTAHVFVFTGLDADNPAWLVFNYNIFSNLQIARACKNLVRNYHLEITTPALKKF